MDDEKKLRQLKITRRLLLVTLLVFTAVFFLMNTEYISLDNTGRLIYDTRAALTGKNTGSSHAEISENAEKEAVVFKNGFVTAAKSILTVYSSGMYRYSEHAVSLENPVLKTSEKRILAFDRGGKNAYVFDSFSLLHTFECAESIINAGIDNSGSVYIITQSYGYKARLSVYNSSYAEIFNWDCAEEYVIDAVIGNGYVWAVSLLQNTTAVDTVLRKIDYSEATILQKVSVEGAVYAATCVKRNNEIGLITDVGVFRVVDSEKTAQYAFGGGTLTAFAQSVDYTFLEADGKTVLLDNAGNTLFSKEFAGVHGLYIHGSSFYVYHGKLLTVFDSAGTQTAEYTVPDATVRVLVSEDLCYAIGADFAEKIIF